MSPIKNPSSPTAHFKPGDQVYARYFGDDILLVRKLADTGKSFPHYVCSLNGKCYLVSQLHLSSKRLSSFVEDGNRKQLPLPI